MIQHSTQVQECLDSFNHALSILRAISQERFQDFLLPIFVRIAESHFLESQDRRNGKSYGLSHRDLEMAAIAIAHNYSLCSTDVSLIDFLEQQYSISNAEPLQIVNDSIGSSV
jgi:hypothetical protein